MYKLKTLICDIDDQNKRNIFVLKGIQTLYLKPNLQQRWGIQLIETTHLKNKFILHRVAFKMEVGSSNTSYWPGLRIES
jgi:hypothetical protein